MSFRHRVSPPFRRLWCALLRHRPQCCHACHEAERAAARQLAATAIGERITKNAGAPTFFEETSE